MWTEGLVAARMRDAAARSAGCTDVEGDDLLVRDCADVRRWLSWLAPEDAALVHARVVGVRWKLICWRFGVSRPTAYRRWRHALALIAWRLNGRRVPDGQSRRQFLEAVRSVSA